MTVVLRSFRASCSERDDANVRLAIASIELRITAPTKYIVPDIPLRVGKIDVGINTNENTNICANVLRPSG